MKPSVRAVIVDDEAPARERLATLLAAHPQVQIAGEAADIDSAIEVCERLAPDVVFLDVQLRRENGFDLLSRLRKLPNVIFVTAHDQYAVGAFEVNALDYLLKPIDPDRLADALARLTGESTPAPANAGTQRWKRIEEIYDLAQASRPAERSALLDRLCSADLDIRSEVESLLKADDDAGHFLSPDDLKEHIVELGEAAAGSLVGTMVGRYQVDSEIGAGAMGVVYLARDTTLDRKVALKLLPAHFTQDSDRTTRFVREAKAASALNHPNILTIHEIGQTGDTWFMATEFVEGVTLRKRLESGALGIEEAVDIAMQCVAALETAHRAGIIHRDIKPENIMIRYDGVVKVIDFGLALVAGPSQEFLAGRTEPGKVIGTPRYMSPEQARGEKLDGRSDIFSIGTVLYEMLEGSPAFPGTTAAEVFASLLGSGSDTAIKKANTLIRSYPSLGRILPKALKKEADWRYQTMSEFAGDLKELRRKLHAGAAGSKIRPWIYAAALALLLSIAAARPQRIWNWLNRPQPVRSLAVLPLLNLSNDPQQEYLVDGMTDNLITELARQTSLRVISRTSVMQYKGVSKPLSEIAEALDVDAVMEGSVRKSNGQLLITAQLIDARKDRHLWARNYQRGEGELLSLVSEIAQDVQHEVTAATIAAKESVAQPVNPQAYDLYLRGRYAWNKRTGDGYREALDYFNQSIEHDPEYAPAYAGLADSYLLLGEFLIWPQDDAYVRARAAARRALEFDPTLGEAYASLGQISANEWNWADADREFQRAVELRSGYATAHQWRAEFLVRTARVEEAVSEIKRARELDPLSPVINTQLGWILTFARRYDEAAAQLNSTIELAPRFALAYADMGMVYDAKGNHAEALKFFKKAAEIDDTPDRQVWMARQYAMTGQSAVARQLLDPLLPLGREARVSPGTVALVYIALGDYDEAFKWMELGCRVHSLAPLSVFPPVDPVRSDPRFANLLRCMQLQP